MIGKKNAQIFLFLYEYVQFKTLNEIISIYPYCMAGNEMGEYSVLCNIGTVEVFDVIRMICSKFEFFQRYYAKYDCDRLTAQNVNKRDWKRPISELKQDLKAFKLQNISYKVCYNVDELSNIEGEDSFNKFSEELLEPEDWRQILEYFHKQNVSKVIQIGFTPMPTALFGDNPLFQHWSLLTKMDMEKNKYELYPEKNPKLLMKKLVGAAVCVKNQNDNLNEYQEKVLPAYRQLQRIYEYNEKKGSVPTDSDITEGIKLLMLIFQAKHSEKHMKKIIQELLYETGMVEILRNIEKNLKI